MNKTTSSSSSPGVLQKLSLYAQTLLQMQTQGMFIFPGALSLSPVPHQHVQSPMVSSDDLSQRMF